MVMNETGWVVAFTPRRFASGRDRARAAVSTTGNTSGGHPASTALTATTRRVRRRSVGPGWRSTSSGLPRRMLEHGVHPSRCRRHQWQPVAPSLGLEQLVEPLGRFVVQLDQDLITYRIGCCHGSPPGHEDDKFLYSSCAVAPLYNGQTHTEFNQAQQGDRQGLFASAVNPKSRRVLSPGTAALSSAVRSAKADGQLDQSG